MMGDDTFHLVITTVAGASFDGEARSVTLPGSEGVMTILANHEPFISTLSAGTAVVKDDTGAESSYAVDGGVIECAGNRVTVLL